MEYDRIDDFIKHMPKIELHAHLNGCLTTKALLELGAIKYGKTSPAFMTLCKSFKSEQPSITECFQKFEIAHNLTDTKSTLFKTTMRVVEEFAADNVIYLELRTTPKDTPTMSKSDYLKCVLDAVRHCQNLYPNIRTKLIPSIDRAKGVEAARTTLEIIKKLRILYPDLIKGIDLSGNPSKGCFDDFKKILNDARKCGLELLLHCGEVENDDEVYNMISFGMARCGHGTFVKNTSLELLMKKRIPVECCLSSNICTGTVKCFEIHHFRNFFSRLHPVVICTDDFGIFDTSLSQEFSIATKVYNLTKYDLLWLNHNAIEFSLANANEKDELRSCVKRYFESKNISANN